LREDQDIRRVRAEEIVAGWLSGATAPPADTLSIQRLGYDGDNEVVPICFCGCCCCCWP